jgi:hypothetical protein
MCTKIGHVVILQRVGVKDMSGEIHQKQLSNAHQMPRRTEHMRGRDVAEGGEHGVEGAQLHDMIQLHDTTAGRRRW